ncbi:MAG: four helix bundle protein [Leptolyngbya sp. SIO1E4]|nr:four helix bundle protein [Leptolyngbya sp. SIO1E4]
MGRGVVNSYRDLKVWQQSMNLAEMAYQLTRDFPKQEMYGMSSQIRRAAASVPANIAEGYGRGSRGDYVRFLRIAQGSLKELETHILLAQRVQLMQLAQSDLALHQCESVGKLLHLLIKSLQKR